MAELNREQQVELLSLARKTIADTLGESFESVPVLSEPVFDEKRGAFVTLHIKSQLRGCIGYIVGIKSIRDAVADMARAAAFRDPRFRPLGKNEYPSIDIEISILSPIEEVKNVEDIVVGRDGLIISMGGQSGLLLPQVPVEQGWERDEFLEHTCYKAGLPGGAWKQKGVKIEKFSAQVFGEKELGIS